MLPITDDESLVPILAHLTDMVEELAVDMQQLQWRLAKLERQFGSTGNDQ